MGIALVFLLFTIGFAYLMDKWSREFEEFDGFDDAEPALAENVVVGQFGRANETKRAA
jgi:hypothetical protein